MSPLYSQPDVKYDCYRTPLLQVRTNCLIIWMQPDYPYTGDRKPPQKNTYSGNMTPGSRKRLTRAMENLVQHSKKRWIYNPCLDKHHTHTLSFLTLTIPPDRLILADEGYPILKRFLRNAERVTRHNTGLKSYLWKAEIQTNTGQLHYHLATNSFLRMDYCKDWWNKELKKEGLLDGHANRFGNFHPPTTHIKGPKNHDHMMHYLTKYISKDSQNTQVIKGKVWDCSTDLKSSLCKAEVDQETDFKIQRALSEQFARVTQLENCTIINHPNPLKLLSNRIIQDYKKWLQPQTPQLPLYQSPSITAQEPPVREKMPWEDVIVPF